MKFNCAWHSTSRFLCCFTCDSFWTSFKRNRNGTHKDVKIKNVVFKSLVFYNLHLIRIFNLRMSQGPFILWLVSFSHNYISWSWTGSVTGIHVICLKILACFQLFTRIIYILFYNPRTTAHSGEYFLCFLICLVVVVVFRFLSKKHYLSWNIAIPFAI